MASQYTDISELHNANSNTILESMTEAPTKRAWTGFILAAVEAVCAFYVAAAKAGLVLVSANIGASFWATFIHQDMFRIPILILAFAGSGFNLYLLWNARRLRNAPAAAWRKKPLTTQERWRIRIVLLLSLFTLAFVSSEVYFHRLLHHTAF